MHQCSYPAFMSLQSYFRDIQDSNTPLYSVLQSTSLSSLFLVVRKIRKNNNANMVVSGK